MSLHQSNRASNKFSKKKKKKLLHLAKKRVGAERVNCTNHISIIRNILYIYIYIYIKKK